MVATHQCPCSRRVGWFAHHDGSALRDQDAEGRHLGEGGERQPSLARGERMVGEELALSGTSLLPDDRCPGCHRVRRVQAAPLADGVR